MISGHGTFQARPSVCDLAAMRVKRALAARPKAALMPKARRHVRLWLRRPAAKANCCVASKLASFNTGSAACFATAGADRADWVQGPHQRSMYDFSAALLARAALEQASAFAGSHGTGNFSFNGNVLLNWRDVVARLTWPAQIPHLCELRKSMIETAQACVRMANGTSAGSSAARAALTFSPKTMSRS